MSWTRSAALRRLVVAAATTAALASTEAGAAAAIEPAPRSAAAPLEPAASPEVVDPASSSPRDASGPEVAATSDEQKGSRDDTTAHAAAGAPAIDPASAPEVATSNAADPTPAHTPVQVKIGGRSTLTLSGYLETYYSYNFNRPSNGLTNFRAFDNRHNALTLQNLALDAAWEAPRVYGRIALQVGQAPATYYGTSEPTQAGSSGAAGSDAALLRNIQQAYAGVRPFKRAPGIFLEGGIFLSPIGFESLAVRDNWHWSQSPLFFSLPFYHSGLHLGADLSRRDTLKLAVYNGWNNVIDNNREKSLALIYNHTHSERLSVAAVYFTGVERATGADERPSAGAGPIPWRHLVNVSVLGAPHRRLGLVGNLNGGIEPNRFGASGWFAVAGGVRVEATRWLFLAGRGSWFDELRARSADGIADPIVLPNFSASPRQWLAAGTFTVDLRPARDNFAIKLEYRHDHALQPVFFQGAVVGDGSDAAPYVANARAQDTLTLGLNAWF
ncbi:MAG: outer membrane beta-barrel protein [Nannocystaceae bacterium]